MLRQDIFILARHIRHAVQAHSVVDSSRPRYYCPLDDIVGHCSGAAMSSAHTMGFYPRQVCQSSKQASLQSSSHNRLTLAQEALYDAIGAVNIITDAAIVAISILMMWNVHVSSSKRINICLTFIVRFV